MRGKPKLFIIHTQRASEMEEDTTSHIPTGKYEFKYLLIIMLIVLGDVTEAVPFYNKNTRLEKSKVV